MPFLFDNCLIILIPSEARYGAFNARWSSNTKLPVQLPDNIFLLLLWIKDQRALGVSKPQIHCSIGRKTFGSAPMVSSFQ
jgi:hypothetical protein